MGANIGTCTSIANAAHIYGLSLKGIRLLLNAAGIKPESFEGEAAGLSPASLERLEAYVAGIPPSHPRGKRFKKHGVEVRAKSQPTPVPRESLEVDRSPPSPAMLAALTQKFSDPRGNVADYGSIVPKPAASTPGQLRRQARKRFVKQQAAMRKMLQKPHPTAYFGSLDPHCPDD